MKRFAPRILLPALLPVLLPLLVSVACGGGGKRAEDLPAYMSVAGGYVTLNGFALGTSFQITYKNEKRKNYYDSIARILDKLENSLSIYRKNSIISRINRNEEAVPDSCFLAVFDRAREITELTGGAFDISASPLFDLWGWGAKKRATAVTQELIDSLKQFTGMDKIRMENGRAVKTHPGVTLNVNAIAKGFATDVVALFLQSRGIENYLVEIGGEIRVKGRNRTGKDWRVGIDSPFDGNMTPGENLQTVLEIRDEALATSGNYRRFYIENGQKYSHTVDPKTGRPAKQNILSATVIARDCMTADAFATAFMVMGLEQTKAFLLTHPELKVYLIYSDGDSIKEFRKL
jgi:thiamine biosynthesis lipoprotein